MSVYNPNPMLPKHTHRGGPLHWIMSSSKVDTGNNDGKVLIHKAIQLVQDMKEKAKFKRYEVDCSTKSKDDYFGTSGTANVNGSNQGVSEEDNKYLSSCFLNEQARSNKLIDLKSRVKEMLRELTLSEEEDDPSLSKIYSGHKSIMSPERRGRNDMDLNSTQRLKDLETKAYDHLGGMNEYFVSKFYGKVEKSQNNQQKQEFPPGEKSLSHQDGWVWPRLSGTYGVGEINAKQKLQSSEQPSHEDVLDPLDRL